MAAAQLRINGKKQDQISLMQMQQITLYQISNLATLHCMQLFYPMHAEIQLVRTFN